MQIYALDKTALIAAPQAEKKKDYTCPECKGLVRVRGGEVRQSHFFHLQSTTICRLAQKGLIHLRLQKFIKYLFENEAEMEKAFPKIGRIADVACPKSKKIFEIQYSPISLEEAKARCTDYESLGYHIIWILHDHTFNQEKVGPAEKFLRTKTCYFSNMNEDGIGDIYDSLDEIKGKNRTYLDEGNVVNLRKCFTVPKHKWPKELLERASSWPLYHENDYIDTAMKGKFPIFVVEVQNPLKTLKEFYLGCLEFLLEKSSK